MYKVLSVIKVITLLILISGCATSPEDKAAKMAEIKAMTNWELCGEVRIQNWPPTWRGGKGLFWVAMEADYRKELISRGITPFDCSNASKRCVSYGFEFGSSDHKSCTLQEGQNIAGENFIKQQRKNEQYKSIFQSQ